MFEPEKINYAISWPNMMTSGRNDSYGNYIKHHSDSEIKHIAFGLVETTNLLGISIAQRAGEEGLLLIVEYEGGNKQDARYTGVL